MLLVAKGSLLSSNSYAAQGGVAAAVGADDDPALHAEDTLAAGRGLCRPSAVRTLTEDAPARIADLVRLGVAFDEGLAREGGHGRRRVVHAGGAETGRRIAEVLAERVRAHPRIEVAEGERAVGLSLEAGRCVGLATDRRTVTARATLLATGGYAGLWARTTNPPGALGEGLVLAYRAGAALADLELMQFHPTALVGDGFLLSEALRGDGAVLLDATGERFTDELAPRDVVARAIAAREQAGLDLRSIERTRYPTLMATLERAGYDPALRADPGRAGRALLDRRHRHRSRRPQPRARPLRGGRVRVHGRARREPARVELAARVPRLRAPGGARGARRARAARRHGGRTRSRRRPPGRSSAARSGRTPA